MTHVTLNALTNRIYFTVYLRHFDTLSKQKWFEKLLSEYWLLSQRMDNTIMSTFTNILSTVPATTRADE